MSNLLYNRRGVLKVGDFGLARFVGSGGKGKGRGEGEEEKEKEEEEEGRGGGACLTPTVITLWYRPPELLLGEKDYDEAVDMWSVGCIMGELLAGKPLFPGKSEIDQFHRMFELLGVPTEKIWPGMSDLPLAKRIKEWGYAQPYNNISGELYFLQRFLSPSIFSLFFIPFSFSFSLFLFIPFPSFPPLLISSPPHCRSLQISFSKRTRPSRPTSHI